MRFSDEMVLRLMWNGMPVTIKFDRCFYGSISMYLTFAQDSLHFRRLSLESCLGFRSPSFAQCPPWSINTQNQRERGPLSCFLRIINCSSQLPSLLLSSPPPTFNLLAKLPSIQEPIQVLYQISSLAHKPPDSIHHNYS